MGLSFVYAPRYSGVEVEFYPTEVPRGEPYPFLVSILPTTTARRYKTSLAWIRIAFLDTVA